MSVIKPRAPQLIRFFRTGPLPCPYIAGQTEKKLFTRIGGPEANAINAKLTEAGFRRSHDVVYRRTCDHCAACEPVRIPVATFAPGRTMRRMAARNSDLNAKLEPAVATAEHYRLFIDYECSRHADSDMARMTYADFVDMIEDGGVDSALLCLRDQHGLLYGAMLVDRVGTSNSAVYSYFRVLDPRRSLGTQLVVSAVAETLAAGGRSLYLGYHIAQSPKMAYKARFKPLEVFRAGRWQPYSADRSME